MLRSGVGCSTRSCHGLISIFHVTVRTQQMNTRVCRSIASRMTESTCCFGFVTLFAVKPPVCAATELRLRSRHFSSCRAPKKLVESRDGIARTTAEQPRSCFYSIIFERHSHEYFGSAGAVFCFSSCRVLLVRELRREQYCPPQQSRSPSRRHYREPQGSRLFKRPDFLRNSCQVP